MSAFQVVLLCVGLAFFAVQVWRIQSGWRSRLRTLAAARGWRVVPSRWPMGVPSVQGEVQGCRVTVEMPWRVPGRHDRQPSGLAQVFGRRRERAWDYAQVTVALELPLRFEPEAGRIGRLVLGRDLELGDPSFDEAVRVGGDASRLRAAFDAETRWAVRLLVERGGAFDGQRLVLGWKHEDSALRDADAVDAALAATTALVRQEGTTRARLARIAAEDAKPGVRHGALACLIARHRGAPETAEAAQRALADADPAVRGAAAVHLDDRPTLEALLAPGPPMAVRVAAVEALARSDAGLAVIRQVVARLDGEARAAAVAALKSAGGVEVGGLALAEVDGGGLALAGDGPERRGGGA